MDNGAGEVAKLSGEILLSGGKRLRPLLGIFCYEVAGGTDLDEIMDLAIAFELIHTATLIHDDINDAAKLRRGVTTLHERIGQPKPSSQATGSSFKDMDSADDIPKPALI